MERFTMTSKSQSVNDSYVPVFQHDEGFYAVVALDPMASVRYLDAEAAVEAQGLKTRRYLALIRPLFGWYDTLHAPHYELDIYFVGRGMPNDSVSQMDGSMSVPVYPAEKHPESRPPLRPSQPLPWGDCYHYTRIVEYLARSGTIYPSTRPCSVLRGSDVDVLNSFCIEDERPHFDTYYDTSDSESVSSNELEFISQDPDLLPLPSEGGSVSTDLLDDMLATVPQGVYATYDICLDLNTLTDIPDPMFAKKELMFLDRLQKDYNKRENMRCQELWAQCKAGQLRTMAWANHVVLETKQEPHVEIFEQQHAIESLSSIHHSQALTEAPPRVEARKYGQEIRSLPASALKLGFPEINGRMERSTLNNPAQVSYL